MSTEEKVRTLTEKADAAFHRAAITVIQRARQTGTPVIVWENGRVMERSGEELMARSGQTSDEEQLPAKG
jgi:hypothetical protein